MSFRAPPDSLSVATRITKIHEDPRRSGRLWTLDFRLWAIHAGTRDRRKANLPDLRVTLRSQKMADTSISIGMEPDESGGVRQTVLAGLNGFNNRHVGPADYSAMTIAARTG